MSGGVDFLESISAPAAGNSNAKTDEMKDLRTELSQVQAHHVEAVNELEKTRSLLRVQANINQEHRNENDTLQSRILQLKAEFQSQIGKVHLQFSICKS